MLQTTPLLPVLLAASLTARLRGDISPDDTAEAFLTAGLPVPLVVTDQVFAPPVGAGAQVPCGLLLWEAGVRRAGRGARVRAEPVHPALPLRVPRLDREARKSTARAAARTRALCVVEDSAGTSTAVLAIGLEADTVVVPCAPTPYTTVDHLTAGEACRRLRETVMHALTVVEAEGRTEADALPWRDWQSDLSGVHDDTIHTALAMVLGDHERARSLHTAMHVHHSLSALAVPAQTGSPELGSALEQVHVAAARVITALTRMDT